MKNEIYRFQNELFLENKENSIRRHIGYVEARDLIFAGAAENYTSVDFANHDIIVRLEKSSNHDRPDYAIYHKIYKFDDGPLPAFYNDDLDDVVDDGDDVAANSAMKTEVNLIVFVDRVEAEWLVRAGAENLANIVLPEKENVEPVEEVEVVFTPVISADPSGKIALSRSYEIDNQPVVEFIRFVGKGEAETLVKQFGAIDQDNIFTKKPQAKKSSIWKKIVDFFTGQTKQY